MYFSISAIELLLTLVTGATALAFYARHDDRYRWAFAAFVCAVFAATMTPADPVSMILMFVTLLGFFTFGTRFRIAENRDDRDSVAIESSNSQSRAIAIALLAVCVFCVGRLYAVSLPEPMFGYQAFRVWATNMTSGLLLAVACVVWLHGLTTRRRGVNGLST